MIPTRKQFRQARKELLSVANCYEVKKRKFLRGVFYRHTPQGFHFQWIGKAHDYSYWL